MNPQESRLEGFAHVVANSMSSLAAGLDDRAAVAFIDALGRGEAFPSKMQRIAGVTDILRAASSAMKGDSRLASSCSRALDGESLRARTAQLANLEARSTSNTEVVAWAREVLLFAAVSGFLLDDERERVESAALDAVAHAAAVPAAFEAAAAVGRDRLDREYPRASRSPAYATAVDVLVAITDVPPPEAFAPLSASRAARVLEAALGGVPSSERRRLKERFMVGLADAGDRERGVGELFEVFSHAALGTGVRLSADTTGQARQVLLRKHAGGEFLLQWDGRDLCVLWTGAGRPTLALDSDGARTRLQGRHSPHGLRWVLPPRTSTRIPRLRAGFTDETVDLFLPRRIEPRRRRR